METKTILHNRSEDGIQNECYIWFNNNYCLKNLKDRCLIFSVPNGGTRNVVEAIKLKNTGTLSGVSDLIVVLPNKILFVEMKIEGGRLSDNQKDFKQRVEALGFEYHVAWSVEDFKTMILHQLNLIGYVKEMLKS